MKRSYAKRITTASLLVAGIVLQGGDAVAESFTITIDGVDYALPSDKHNFWAPNLEPSNPYKYIYQYMRVVIKDRELYINDKCRYRAKGGDRVAVTYIPNEVVVNGVKIPEREGTSLSDVCP